MGGKASGRGGISPHLVRRCEELLELGDLSLRAVARRLGIDERTVRRIQAGEHFLQLAIDEARYARCGCGALTDEQPCKLCRLRAAGL